MRLTGRGHDPTMMLHGRSVMALDEVADLWCSLFGYASCFYVPAEMIAVPAVSAALATFAVIAVLFGLLQKLLG